MDFPDVDRTSMPSERDTRATPLEAVGGLSAAVERRPAAPRLPDRRRHRRDRQAARPRPCSPTAAEVRAIVRDAERGRAILGPAVELFEADLTREPDLDEAMEGVDARLLPRPHARRGPRLRRARARRRRALRPRGDGGRRRADDLPRRPRRRRRRQPPPRQPPRHRGGPARARAAAHLLPRRDGGRPRQRVLRAAALDRRAGSRPFPSPAGCARAPSRSGCATSSPTSATLRGSPPRRAARSRSAGPT